MHKTNGTHGYNRTYSQNAQFIELSKTCACHRASRSLNVNLEKHRSDLQTKHGVASIGVIRLAAGFQQQKSRFLPPRLLWRRKESEPVRFFGFCESLAIRLLPTGNVERKPVVPRRNEATPHLPQGDARLHARPLPNTHRHNGRFRQLNETFHSEAIERTS